MNVEQVVGATLYQTVNSLEKGAALRELPESLRLPNLDVNEGPPQADPARQASCWPRGGTEGCILGELGTGLRPGTVVDLHRSDQLDLLAASDGKEATVPSLHLEGKHVVGPIVVGVVAEELDLLVVDSGPVAVLAPPEVAETPARR